MIRRFIYYRAPNIDDSIIIDLFSMDDASVVVLSGNVVKSWGYNVQLELGVNDENPRATPTSIYGTHTFESIVVSKYKSVFGLKNNGELWGWGRGSYGMLGNNSLTCKPTPVQVCGGHTFCKVVAGYYHTLGLDVNGKLWSWGYNNFGQLGTYDKTSYITPKAVSGADKTFCSIGCGTYSSFAIDNHGWLWGWGYNQYGGLGNNTAVSICTPTSVYSSNGITSFISVDAGYSHFMSLTNDGLWSCGKNDVGQLGTGDSVSKSTPVKVSCNHNFTKVKCFYGTTIAYESPFLYAWGRNNYGQLGSNYGGSYIRTPRKLYDGAPHSANFSIFSIGDGMALGVHNDVLWGWGHRQLLGDVQNSTPTSVSVNGNASFCYIGGLSYARSYFIDSDGFGWSCGYNYSGVLGINSLTSQETPTKICGSHSLTYIEGGYQHSVACSASGSGWTWGNSSYGQRGANTTVSVRTPSLIYNGYSVVGDDSTGIYQVDAGYYYCLGIKGKNGEENIISWGRNDQGQLGDNTLIDRSTPVYVRGSLLPKKIACGYYHNVAIDSDDTLYSWGDNLYGKLGDNSTTDRSTPIAVHGNRSYVDIACGRHHVLAIENTGRLMAWGNNTYGQLGDYTTTSRITPVYVCNNNTFCTIVCGEYHSMAIDNHNILWTWGDSTDFQTGRYVGSYPHVTPKSISNHTFCCIGSGYDHSFGVNLSGETWAWGDVNYGASGIQLSSYTPISICDFKI